jgi:hypothetical protein
MTAARSRLAAAALSALAGCAARVAAPAPSCPADRAIVLAAPADVASLAGCAAVRGLAVRTGAALDLSPLGALTSVTGDLVIGPTTAIEDVALPALRTVGGAIRVVGNGTLQRLRLPALEQAGQVAIDGNPALATLAMPRLQVVRGAVRITDNAGLELVDLAALSSVDQELVVAGDPGLSLIEAGALQRAASVRIDAPRLPPGEAERLRHAAPPP